MGRNRADELISVVLPSYNEAAVLPRLADEVRSALGASGERFELVFVNDGSTDASARILDRLAAEDARVRVVHLARNFGHQAAVQAGLTYARGDAVAVMDSDLQDDPQALPLFLAHWRAGFDVVYAVRVKRKEGRLKRLLFFAFYRLLNLLAHERFPADAGNFSLLDRRVVDELLRLGERDRYFPGLRHWVGFRQTGIPVERGARHDKHPRVTLWGLFRLAKTAIFSFSSAPLAAFYFVAVLLALGCFASAVFALAHSVASDGVPLGLWTIVAGSFFGSLNALGVAVLGEYLVRVYDQVRARPAFLVARTVNGEREHRPAAVSELGVYETVSRLHDELQSISSRPTSRDELAEGAAR